ncbi:MAG: hypothetical protein Q8P90_04650 [bacterium]|nr:hypothetical protein [bacterium]
MKKILVDYHFHPNLSKNDNWARHKCKAIWHEFVAKKMDVVVITEHVFKNPARAFRLLQETKPKDTTTLIFPGIEALTKEGVDFIVFAKDTTIYDHQKIMVPKQLDVFEMINYLKKYPSLFGSIAHPYGLGNSGIIHQIGLEKSLAAINLLGGVEVSNVCFRGSQKFFDYFKLSKIFKEKRQRSEWVSKFPNKFYDINKMNLITGGSDAHVIVEIGSGLKVPIKNKATRSEIFKAISHNKSTTVKETDERLYLWLGLYKIYSVILESLTKALRLYEGKVYQQDDQFTNFFSEAEKEAIISYRKRRGKILKPILNLLTYFELTPSTLNVLSIGSIIGSFVIVSIRPLAGIIWFSIYLVSSGLTTALAKYQHKESEAGAITKIAVQYVALFTAILAALWFEWASPFWSALYLGLYTIMLWLIIALNQIGQPIRLVVRSKFVIIIGIFVYALGSFNFITELLMIFSVYMAGADTWMLFRYRRASTEIK